jgi:hypothetical protein
MKQFKYYVIIILLLIVFIVPFSIYASWWNPFSWNFWSNVWDNSFHNQMPILQQDENNENKNIICTQEVKICPDGSSVGRVGVNCEFEQCPDLKIEDQACNLCKDSDGGINYYLRGSANPCSSVDGSTRICPPCGAWIDKCLDDKILLEYSCENLDGEEYVCPNGCKDGRCN